MHRRLYILLILGLFAECTLSLRAGCGSALGMEKGTIRNTQLSAESSDRGWGPGDGRLNGDSAWCSDSEKVLTSYFQIRLDELRHVSGIGTQGQRYGLLHYYVRTYAIKYSLDGLEWHWYKDAGSSEKKTFTGNTDYSNEHKISFRDTFVTWYLRIYPLTFKRDMCLRVELYGCPNNLDCTHALSQKTSGDIASPNYPLPYPQGIECTWIVTLPDSAKRVAAIFQDFDVQEGQSWSCNGDFVDILDGQLDTSNVVGHFCNGKPIVIVRTTGNALRVRFHSEKDSKPRKGFRIHYLSYKPGIDDIRIAVACQETQLTLNCSTQNTTHIVFARYGVFPYSTACGSAGSNTSCAGSHSNTTSALRSRCQHTPSCVVMATRPVFDVSCSAGVVPRLDVYYQCVGPEYMSTAPPPPTTTQAATLPTNVSSPVTETPPPRPETNTPSGTMLVVSEVSTRATTGQGGGDEKNTGEGTGLIVGLVVAITCVVLLIVVILAIFFWRRHKATKQTLIPSVTYTADHPYTAPSRPPQRTGRTANIPRNYDYETVNILYASGDDSKENGMVHDATESTPIYDSPETLPKSTENPIYDSSRPSDGYETVNPPAASSPVYDSPLETTTPRSISNPSYDRNMIEIPLV